ncbi:conjugal transfer protein TraF [Vibrio mediterranei]
MTRLNTIPMLSAILLTLLTLLAPIAASASGKDTLGNMISTRAKQESTNITTLLRPAPKPNPTATSPWQLVFVFADWCPYCHRTAPIVKAWSKRHHIPVRAISITQKGLPDYPTFEALSPSDSAAWFHGSIRVPALLAQSTANPKRIIGLATGAVTDSQLTSLWTQGVGRQRVERPRPPDGFYTRSPYSTSRQ